MTAYDSIKAGFEDFLTHQLDGRPFVVIGDSQGAAMLNMLLARLVDDVPALRSRLVTAIILGGNVEVQAGQLVGGTFKHIPACSRLGETGCVIAYSSSRPRHPPIRCSAVPGQGVSLQSGQTARQGLQVVCVNPAALSGGRPPSAPSSPHCFRRHRLLGCPTRVFPQADQRPAAGTSTTGLAGSVPW